MATDPDDPGTGDLFGAPAIPRRVRRIVDTGTDLAAHPPAIDRADFLHTVLCQVGMPRRRTTELTFERTNGGATLVLDAGRLMKGGKMVQMPLPYGTKPRLMMIHVCGFAVRHQTRVIPLGDSLRQYMLGLGLADGGGDYREFRRQTEALAACRLTLGMSHNGRDITIKADPFRRFEAWLSDDGRQASLIPAELELTQEFYESVREFSVPLAHDAIAALKQSSLALDFYSWLVHRLPRVKKPTMLSWQNLRDQFGQEYKDPKDFKREAKKAMREALAVYPEARVEDVIGGVMLHTSRPALPRR